MNPEESFNRSVAKRIRQAREATGLSQEDLGAKIGMSKVGYGHYERGTHLPNLWQLMQLSRLLNRPIEWFLGLPSELTADEQQVLALYRQAVALQRGIVAVRILEGVIAE